ncbi:hypothetical protein ES319_A12G274100v1 [Gossypium barbadense]|uniref:Uncharacterized protein n=1 Tax=Gossypium barbadense TaxID=3634 RepID=A0A5J5TGH6_GOSBA|nr:hypothetical protein ES319_A12G274100v1 [Gossypium barbadense]
MSRPPKVPFMAAIGMSRLALMIRPWIWDCLVTYWRKSGLMKRRWPSIGKPTGPGGDSLVLMMCFLTNREK